MTDSLSKLLFGTIYQDVIGKETSPYNEMIRKMYRIDTDYFQDIPADTEKLNDRLSPRLRDDVVEFFRRQADFYFGPLYQDALLRLVLWTLKAEAPNVDPQTIAEACDTVKPELVSAAQYRFNHPNYQYEIPCPQVSEQGMMKAYQKAKERTIVERISKVNKADVLAFYYALLHKTVWDCKQLIEDKTIEAIVNVLEQLKNQEPITQTEKL